jgi:hypothetical protein
MCSDENAGSVRTMDRTDAVEPTTGDWPVALLIHLRLASQMHPFCPSGFGGLAITLPGNLSFCILSAFTFTTN